MQKQSLSYWSLWRRCSARPSTSSRYASNFLTRRHKSLHCQTMYDDIVPINRIVNKTPANLYLMDRPDLVSSFTKVELWRQTQYEQIVYIDADVVALRAPNELLRLDTGFAAVPDIGWPDCFNSGVMVLKPNMGDYYSLLALAQRGISFDGADQGLLNMHFRDWERLSFTYNCTPSGNYQYVPAYRHFQSSVNLVHYIGHEKPWVLGRETKHSTGVYDELLGRWWATYDRYYRSSVCCQPIQSFLFNVYCFADDIVHIRPGASYSQKRPTVCTWRKDRRRLRIFVKRTSHRRARGT